MVIPITLAEVSQPSVGRGMIHFAAWSQGGCAKLDAKLEQRRAELDAKWGGRWTQLDAKLVQRLAELRVELVKELAGVKSGLKWMLAFWAPTALAVIGTGAGVVSLLLRR